MFHPLTTWSESRTTRSKLGDGMKAQSVHPRASLGIARDPGQVALGKREASTGRRSTAPPITSDDVLSEDFVIPIAGDRHVLYQSFQIGLECLFRSVKIPARGPE
jgi:hypothetical protein